MKTIALPVLLFLAVVTVACSPVPENRAPSAEPPPITAGARQPAAEPAPEPAPEPTGASPAATPQTTPQPAPEPQPGAPPSPPAPVGADPLQQIRAQQTRQEDRRLALERANDRMSAAQENVATLEKRLLAVRNPYLPRPQLPPDEAKAWEGLDGAARAKRVEDQLAVARAELEAARKAYGDLGGRLD